MSTSVNISFERVNHQTFNKSANATIPLRWLCNKVRDKSLCRAHQSWKSETQIMSPTFMICVRDKSATLSQTCHGLCCRLFPCLSRTLSQTSRHVEMICVRDFRDLCWRLSPKLHGFMICHHLCPRLSWFVSTTFRTGKFWWKSA